MLFNAFFSIRLMDCTVMLKNAVDKNASLFLTFLLTCLFIFEVDYMGEFTLFVLSNPYFLLRLYGKQDVHLAD